MKTFYCCLLSVFFLTISGFSQNPNNTSKVVYDMRTDLSPKRLTIAMWDFSWMYMHYKGGAFENFDKVTDELLERGFNTVRIDAFPLLIAELTAINQEVTIAGDPLQNWGATDVDRKHKVINELLEFLQIARKKNINVILSTWNQGCKEFPEIKKGFTTTEKYWKAWEKVLSILKENKLLDVICYIDFDQEFPFFSPFAPEIDRLGQEKTVETASSLQAMEAAGRVSGGFDKLKWNPAQMTFVRNYMNGSLTHFQHLYPELRFTFSLTSYWEEVRAMKLKSMDVLELHIWMTQSDRFNSRSGFNELTKDRGTHEYSDYMDRVTKTMKSVRPMLMKDMHNRLVFARAWSEEIGAPLTTTEAWGPWWHMDSKDMSWKWLYDWCEQGMDLAGQYGMWGTTPWNYSHPYWENWKNIQWYKKVNSKFLQE
ncbi:MAG: hypothetical protein GZ094_14630 [Mariniphaga sp.]|nr:hypothetical protein [Mariniphaga sp.]